MIEQVYLEWKETNRRYEIKKLWKKEGYVSEYYLMKHGWDIDYVCSLAKQGKLDAKKLITSYWWLPKEIVGEKGETKWFFNKDDLDNLNTEEEVK